MINPNRENCSTPILYFRLIHINETLTSINVSATQIPAFNFCESIIKGIVYYYINVYPLLENYIFATYVNSSNPIDASIYGLLFDWNSNFISNTYLSAASVNKKGIVQPPGKIYFSKKSRNVGFLYVDIMKNTGSVIWNYFTNPLTMSNINSGIIMYKDSLNTLTSGFLNAEGNYCLVIARFSSKKQEPLRVETILIPTQSNRTSSSNLIYSRKLKSFSNIITLNCNIDYKGSGNICQFYFSGGSNMANAFILRLSFLTSGNLTNVETKPANYVHNSNDIKIYPLLFGGYLLTARDRNRKLIYGYILNSTEDFQDYWPLPQPFFLNSKGPSYILPDKKIIGAAQINATNWFLNTTELPKIPIANDKGYYNPQLNLTLPVINGTIPIRTSQILIQYKDPVQLSSGNVSVFIHSNSISTDPIYLRQVYSGQSGHCILSENRKTITIKIFTSTFNQPLTDYFVIIDDNFVKINENGEAVKGIEANVWVFKTEQTVPNIFVESSVALFRLTAAGSILYESLNATEKIEFVNELGNELATILPVTPSRLVPRYQYQRDPTTEEIQVILPLEIISSTNISEMNVINIIEDLNSFIIHRDMGPLAYMKYTYLMDSNYGLVKPENFWDKYLFIIILFIVGILLFTLLCFIEQRRNPKAETSSVFKFSMGFVSYLLFVIFTLRYSKAVAGLYETSLTIVILSTSLKETVSLFLIIREIITSEKFRGWLKKHFSITMLFMLLSAVDVYSLMILTSKIGSKPSLSAPFAKRTRTWIFWVGLFALIKKEIPQFIIVLIYQQKTLKLDLVPFLTLLITSIVLVFNTVWRLNQLFNFFFQSTPRTRRASNIHKSGNTGNTGYETDREDNNADLGNNGLSVPSSEVIFESDEFDEFDDESSPAEKGEKEKDKKKVGSSTESDEEKSFIEEEIEKIG
ncbi:uncharacterized protein OCT59_020085 [Rhizophagus irregularis]|nr:hypothetical protein OCT59_020085 [Rhizophagus irregularis]GBC25702.2 glycosyltransferase family 2 protein [Rhizophagus irregularis DAOM 181602=DAOM 197198]